MRVIVIGAGLAGAATAHALASRGCEVAVLDSGKRSASPSNGLPVALMAPHHSPDDKATSALSQLSRLGIAATTQAARALLVEGQDWQLCRALQRAGKLGPQARWSGDAAWVKPAALVAAWLAHPRITLRAGVQVHSLSLAAATFDPFALSLPKGSQQPRQAQSALQALDAHGTALAQADAVVLANAYQAKALLDSTRSTGSTAPTLPLHQVAGQVIYGPWTAQWQALWPQLLPELREHTDSTTPCAINGNGHFIPAIPWHSGPIWLSGSTYEHETASPQVTAQGIAANLQRLQQLIPAAAQLLAQQRNAGQLQAWAGERCTTRDRLPLVGESHIPGVYMCTAMGSRGLSFAAVCGQHLAATITQAHDGPLPAHLYQAVDASRFLQQNSLLAQ
jgi:tRNA 5-methylaminomethyl-2-thiouridine biosynthesis bifunctional protein